MGKQWVFSSPSLKDKFMNKMTGLISPDVTLTELSDLFNWCKENFKKEYTKEEIVEILKRHFDWLKGKKVSQACLDDFYEKVSNDFLGKPLLDELADIKNFEFGFDLGTLTEIERFVYEKYPEMAKGFQEELDSMFKLFCAKQKDYGPRNISMGQPLVNEKELRIALNSLITRSNDKMQRLVNMFLINFDKPVDPANESVEDSFRDLANYSVIGLLLLKNKWNK